MHFRCLNRFQHLFRNTVALMLCFVAYGFSSDFGYVSYSTTNIGDDIQAIAVRQFLPNGSIPIDRELIGDFDYPSTVSTVVNGWYKLTNDFLIKNKDLYWLRKDGSVPNIMWPPASGIDPLFISIYFNPLFRSTALSDKGVEYLKSHAPIGARDLHTLSLLQDKDIPSYFSGCLTLTLDNPYKGHRNQIIYLVDVPKECVDYVRARVRKGTKVVELSHGIPLEIFLEDDNEARIDYAQKTLDMYCRAKCVITQRLHAAMPCLALETPVLLLVEGTDSRYHGLRELAWHCTKEEFLSGEFDFDYNHPPENPRDYLPIREALIEKMTSWVESKK